MFGEATIDKKRSSRAATKNILTVQQFAVPYNLSVFTVPFPPPSPSSSSCRFSFS